MNFNYRKKTILILTIFILCFFVISNTLAAGDDNKTKRYGLTDTKSTAGLPDVGGGNMATIIGKVVGAGLAFIGVIFFILMIYGGFVWMMARGNEQEVQKAKDLIYSAVIGIIIVLAAYAITYYIGSSLGATTPAAT